MTSARPAARQRGRVTAAAVRVVPANEVSWPDLQAIFGTTGDPGGCYCQWFKVRNRDWNTTSKTQRRDWFRQQTQCGNPAAEATTGLVAYLGAEPVGWVALEPRTAYPRLTASPMVWSGRAEDKADASVWAVTCFVTRRGYRKRGVSSALAAAAVDFARQRGARALEAYPMATSAGEGISSAQLYVGSQQVFAAAGFTEVSRPRPRRVVMRMELG